MLRCQCYKRPQRVTFVDMGHGEYDVKCAQCGTYFPSAALCMWVINAVKDKHQVLKFVRFLMAESKKILYFDVLKQEYNIPGDADFQTVLYCISTHASMFAPVVTQSNMRYPLSFVDVKDLIQELLAHGYTNAYAASFTQAVATAFGYIDRDQTSLAGILGDTVACAVQICLSNIARTQSGITVGENRHTQNYFRISAGAFQEVHARVRDALKASFQIDGVCNLLCIAHTVEKSYYVVLQVLHPLYHHTI